MPKGDDKDVLPSGAESLAATATDIVAAAETTAAILDEKPPRPVVPINVESLWQAGTAYDIRIYINDHPIFNDYDNVEPFVEEYELVYGDLDYKIEKTGAIQTTEVNFPF